MTLLEVRDLDVHLGSGRRRAHILHGIGLTIGAAEILGIDRGAVNRILSTARKGVKPEMKTDCRTPRAKSRRRRGCSPR